MNCNMCDKEIVKDYYCCDFHDTVFCSEACAEEYDLLAYDEVEYKPSEIAYSLNEYIGMADELINKKSS